jgi:hypothetical protein
MYFEAFNCETLTIYGSFFISVINLYMLKDDSLQKWY